jgi:hypothetical protein
MNSATVWLPADANLPVHVKRTIASKKRMLVVFWGIHGVPHYCSLTKNSTLDSPFFCGKMLSAESTRSENAAKFKKTRKPLTLIHMDNAWVRMARATQEKLDVSRFKCMLQPPYGPDIAPSDFSFRLAENPA